VDPDELNLSRNHNMLNAKEKGDQMRSPREARDAQGTHQTTLTHNVKLDLRMIVNISSSNRTKLQT
jgi:hypothetical protein